MDANISPLPSSDCVFCQFYEQNSENVIYSDEDVFVVPDIHPKAKVHLLILSKRHILSVDMLKQEDAALWMKMLLVAQKMAREHGIDIEGQGYQLILNGGRHATRLWPHLHMHLVNGKAFKV